MPEPTDQHGWVTVTTGREHYRTTIRAAGHTLIADEPASVGGTDTGPRPQDMLLAALGSCKTITMRMYADRKGWPLDEVVCRVRSVRSAAGASGPAERIDVEVRITGDLTGEQRRRLIEIGDRCPVHRTITSDLSIQTRLADDE